MTNLNILEKVLRKYTIDYFESLLKESEFNYKKHSLYSRSFNTYSRAFARANRCVSINKGTSAANEIRKDIIRNNIEFLQSAKSKNGKLSKRFWGSL